MSTVATFNIHHGAPAAGPARITDVANVCLDLGADLIALQEVDSWKRRSRWRRQAAAIAAVTGHYVTSAPALRRGVATYGTALLTREAPSAVQFLALPSFGTETRLAVLARVPLAGQVVSVAAMHLQATRGVSELQLDLVVRELTRRPGPHLLLGDLNMGPDQVMPKLRSQRFACAESGPTFPAADPLRTIDWIAVRGLSVVSTDVPDTRVSDHRPLIAQLA